MSNIHVDPEVVFGAGFQVFPIYLDDEPIAFGLKWKSLVIPVKGYEELLPLAYNEMLRENHGISWTK